MPSAGTGLARTVNGTGQLRLDEVSNASAEDSAITRLEHEVRFLASLVLEIRHELPVQRRPLSETSKGLHVRVTWGRRNGLCPCCQATPVCTEYDRLPGSEFDHFFARHRNRADETWLVCSECNRKLEVPDFKTSVRSSFESYQQALRPFLVNQQSEMF